MAPQMSFSQIQRNNLKVLRKNPLAEVSGALGDLGTLLPLMIALTLTESIYLSSTLVLCGVYNILTGVFFGVPLPVQPMKALAAVAISRNYSKELTSGSGLFVAFSVLLLSATGTLRVVSRNIPIPCVKGIQVGAGLSLIISAGSSLLQPLSWTSPRWADNLIWVGFAALFLIYVSRAPRVPYALIVFVLGVILATCLSPRHELPVFQMWRPHRVVPSGPDLRIGILEAGIGQLPLTLLNSVVAVTYLSADLLPNLPAPTETALGLSIFSMNIVSCFVGAMPVCHGSGGLGAQFRFGARSGSSIIILGTFKLLLGLLWGDSLIGILKKLPKGLLGILVIAAGSELARVGESLNHGARDLWEEDAETFSKPREPDQQERQKRWEVMMMTVGGILAFRNDAVGFTIGLLAWWSHSIPNLQHRLNRCWTRRGLFRGPDQEHQALLGRN
jgi:hypothetical protein